MKKVYKKLGLSGIAIIITLIIITTVHFNLNLWNKPAKVIAWDIKSYYAYFPALVIKKDITLEFVGDKDYEYRKFFWRSRTEDGDRIIITSMGLAILYSPFSFIAHFLAPVFDYEQSGFSKPYVMALIFSNLFYLILGLMFLRKILLKYFNDLIAALGVLGALFGTNLYYYSVFEPPMPHAYNFSLTIIFLYLVIRWYEIPKVWTALLIGLIGGLITLVRPSGVFVLILLGLWGITNWKDFVSRILLLIRKWYMVLIMAFFFLLIWVPQFMYWHAITGNYFYYSYGNSGGVFYFENPQFFNQLFSYRSGVLLYSPFLFLSFIGIPFLLKKKEGLFIPVILFLSATYYLLASWWGWWNGGSFGVRSYIDSYGILILGFAAIMELILRLKKIPRTIILGFTIFLIGYGSFTSYQYRRSIIHFDSNSKEMFWGNLFKLKKSKDFWEVAKHNKPDYFPARCGINAYRYRDYPNNSVENCMINKIREIEKDKELFNTYISEAKEKKMSVFLLIRNTLKEECESNFEKEINN